MISPVRPSTLRTMTTLAQAPTTPTDGATLFIGGSWQSAGETYERLDPANLGRTTGIFAAATPELVRSAYDAAHEAQPAWAETPAPARAQLLNQAADLLLARLDEGAHRLTADMGKAIKDARAEVSRSVAILRYFAGELLQPAGETYPSADPSTMLLTVEEPLGVVCAITPWNFPFAIPTWKLAPAIGFGNAVVWKPAEAASGSAVLLTEVLAEAGLPDGVLNLVTGKGQVMSAELTGNRHLAALTFTGSGPVGGRLRQAVADRNVKVQLELGGKNPAIVLADADLEDAATQIARGAMLATGQRCTATSRVYVERPVYGEFLDLLRDRVQDFVVGDPFDEATDIGPLGFVEQRESVERYLQLAHQEGANFIVGGSVPERGCFVAPTILTGVRSTSALVREEIFGPVVVVAEVEDFDAGLEAANDTEFGLSSGLFTRDIGKTTAFIRRTRSGVVHINRETAGVEPHVPFGGLKGSSSMSREQGKAARQFFTTTKTVYLRSR
jgi:acyl-CoA reductase-like NAD-dependent aldehyde dehydrogenase